MIKNGMRPVHPGEILFEEFMKPAEPPINANMLAKALEVPANRITAIIKGQRGITGDTAVRLATLFDTTAEFWMNLQKMYELRLAEQALRQEAGVKTLGAALDGGTEPRATGADDDHVVFEYWKISH